MRKKIIGVTVGTPIGPDSLYHKLNVEQRIDEYLQQNHPGSGSDGYSPTVSVSAIEGGYRITIVDVNETKVVDVLHGTDGANGVSFIPTIDEEFNLSWSNNQGLENPPTVNIKGEPGEPYELTDEDVQRIAGEISGGVTISNNIVDF